MATKKKDSKGKSKSKAKPKVKEKEKEKAEEKTVKGKEKGKEKATPEKKVETAFYEDFSNEQVKAAALEMNEVMELNPALDPEDSDFLSLLEITVEQVLPSDEFTPPTIAVIRYVMEKNGMDVEKAVKKDEEEKPKGKKKRRKKGSKKTKPTIPRKELYTRAHSVADAFKEKVTEKVALVERADQIYQKRTGGHCNMKESVFAYHRVIATLDSLGLAKQDPDGIITYSKNFDGLLG